MARKSEGRRLSRVVKDRLREIESCTKRGESVKAYAERTGQSVHTLYEAMRQARRAGVLPPGRSKRSSAHGRAQRPGEPRFVDAVVVRPARELASHGHVAWRLRLPNGAVLESTTPLDASQAEQIVTVLGATS